MRLKDGENIVCEGFLRTGEKIVFTNERFVILKVHQVQSLSEIRKLHYESISEQPIDKIMDIQSEINTISGIAEMVVSIGSGEDLRCSFGVLIADKLYFGATTINISEYNAIIDIYVNEISGILKRKK